MDPVTAEVSTACDDRVDPFDPMELDPSKTGAIESSLWELQQLQRHYCPDVVRTCALLMKPGVHKLPLMDLSDVLRTSYKRMFDRELRRPMSVEKKRVPPLAVKCPELALPDLSWGNSS